ncbi:lipopolysaccharide biosynthesis protein [Jeotgalibaca sp. MA1X17-3]|uniref:lipopolysaccharide biosynthesis protein n=1 Tax=Jeotgalibaca sp. MA1X17-3 TaxID=2908211 RepID=UPI001F441BAC|nr:lipopolysaccharide biosynthesis protein [Jeotgalibaca sp. MA1X17-3]UJF15385.1 lipopolysaccharide biosynthesis protein [Jeotgalibaca sp. MA1X17-3]
MEKEKTLQKTTIHGMLWSFMDTAGTQVIQLIVHLILARLLTPKDFGIVGMVTIFIALSSVFVDGGLTNGLIREKESTQEDYSTIFYFNLSMAIILYILLFASAEYISVFFEQPQLVNIIKVIGLILIINAFGLIQKTILTKNINFRTQMKINVFSSILSGVIAIVCAISGWGVWSLVVRTMAMQFIQASLLCISNRWFPSLVFSISSFKRLFQFGWKLLLSNLITQLYGNLYSFIIGKSFSATTLGYYSNAVKFSDTAAYSLSVSVEKVSFPVLSSIQDDTARLKRGYKKIIKNAAYLSFPIMLGLAAIAEPFYELFSVKHGFLPFHIFNCFV